MNSWADYYRSAVADEYIPPPNRLFPPERPVIDYNIIADSEPYTSSALRGGGSYSSAALAGGKKLRKGSAEAKRYMAYLRSLRRGGKRGGKYPGLPTYTPRQIKDISGPLRNPAFQEKIRKLLERERRAPRGIYEKYHIPENGSGVIGDLLGMAGSRAAEWFNDMKNTSQELKYLKELKKQKGGDWKSDLKDVFMAPGGPVVGAITLAVKKAQQKKIEKLKKEMGMS